MILYHGTNMDFDEIDISKTKEYKDFGQGFYLTDIKSQAEELAEKRTLIFGGAPIVQKYEFDKSLLSSPKVNVLKFDSTCAEWAEFIYKFCYTFSFYKFAKKFQLCLATPFSMSLSTSIHPQQTGRPLIYF